MRDYRGDLRKFRKHLGQRQTEQLRDERRKPDAAAAHGIGQNHQRPRLEHQATTDGDADGRTRPFHRGEEAADEDVDPQNEVAQAVPPEGVGRRSGSAPGWCWTGTPAPAGAPAGRCPKDHSGDDGHGGEPVPQQLPAAGGVLLAVVEADQRLTALRNAHHHVDDQGVGVGDDGVS